MNIDFKKYKTDRAFAHAIVATENTSIGFIREKLTKILGLENPDDLELEVEGTYNEFGVEKHGQGKIRSIRYEVHYKGYPVAIDLILNDYNIDEISFAYDRSDGLAENYNVDAKFMTSYFNMTEEELNKIFEDDYQWMEKGHEMTAEFVHYMRYKQLEENDFLIDNLNKKYEGF